MNRFRTLLFGLACFAVTACGPLAQLASIASTPPVAHADSTKLDEQVGITVTLAYTAASKAAALAIRTGLVTNVATIRRIGELDRQAYAAVQGVRQAYLAVNAASYTAALAKANAAVNALLSAAVGGTAQARTQGQLVALEQLRATQRMQAIPDPTTRLQAGLLLDHSGQLATRLF